MPRKILIETDEYPYHITNRSNNKEFFDLPLPALWNLSCHMLKHLKRELGIQTYAFVLMSNHYHWVLRTPEKNLSKAMTYFHREVARNANKLSGRVNHFFGGRYKWCIIREEDNFLNCLKYVYRNPVKARLCRGVENYTYSSLNDSKLMSECFEEDHLSAESRFLDCDLNWLNTPFENEIDHALKRALRRREFKLPRNSRKQLPVLEKAQYRKELGTF
jgi:putative transposase